MADVEIYTTPWCPFCVRVRMLLESKGVSFRNIDVNSDPALREEMMHRAGGRHTVPQVFVDGVYVGDSDALHRLDEERKLDAILGIER
ncbi:MAG: glutaredoxin 3 [Parvularculales bacterium]